MIFDIHFTETGVVKEFELDEAPMLHEVLTIREGGMDTKFWVYSVSGGIEVNGKISPGIIRVKRLDCEQ